MARSRKSRLALLVVLIIVIVIGVVIVAGLLGKPTAGLEDIGDWGEASQERTEIITTLWVDNPNPLGISIGENVEMSYELFLNGINLAEGNKAGISIPPGNDTLSVTTELKNQNLPAWWVAFIQNNETIPVRAVPSATIKSGPLTASPGLPTFNRTLLEDATPVISSLSQVASATEGRYTKNISANDIQSQLDQNLISENQVDQITDGGPSDEEITVGYEVKRGWATWGEVSEDKTVVFFHFRLHNPSETVPVPAEPENLGVTVEMNNVELFKARGDDTTLQNPQNFSTREGFEKRVLQPGDTKEVVYAVEMDNEKIDEWFISHVKRGEKTDIRVEFQLLFSAGGTTYRIPEESRIAYTCNLQTGILVDNQETQTTCLKPESAPGVETGSVSEGTSNQSTQTPQTTTAPALTTSRPTVTQPEVDSTPTRPSPDVPSPTLESNPPTAKASATPTQGEAPLEVSFDASGSSDPEGDIEQYIWRFKDGTPPANGETVTHTFQTSGEYNVELVVVDSRGNRDSTTVRITVESRVG